jgi:hypothetical protein
MNTEKAAISAALFTKKQTPYSQLRFSKWELRVLVTEPARQLLARHSNSPVRYTNLSGFRYWVRQQCGMSRARADTE